MIDEFAFLCLSLISLLTALLTAFVATHLITYRKILKKTVFDVLFVAFLVVATLACLGIFIAFVILTTDISLATIILQLVIETLVIFFLLRNTIMFAREFENLECMLQEARRRLIITKYRACNHK